MNYLWTLHKITFCFNIQYSPVYHGLKSLCTAGHPIHPVKKWALIGWKTIHLHSGWTLIFSSYSLITSITLYPKHLFIQLCSRAEIMCQPICDGINEVYFFYLSVHTLRVYWFLSISHNIRNNCPLPLYPLISVGVFLCVMLLTYCIVK